MNSNKKLKKTFKINSLGSLIELENFHTSEIEYIKKLISINTKNMKNHQSKDRRIAFGELIITIWPHYNLVSDFYYA